MPTTNPTFTAQTCTNCGTEFYLMNLKRRIPVRERLTKCRDCRGKTTEKDLRTMTTTLSNFRVEYHAPDYSKGHSFEPYCAILADDAALNGATVRVFNVPDPDESQREAAQFACDAMNQHANLLNALKALMTTAAAFDNQLHAGFKVSQLSAEQSQLYNAINTARAVVYDAERSKSAQVAS